MKILYKILKQKHDSREGVITVTSVFGIIVNIGIALLKIVIGQLSTSIAIISEGINNATDAVTSVMTLLGSALAQKHPDEKHPFGYGRIEYLSSLLISILILITGIETLISSVKNIFNSKVLSVSALSLIIVACSAVIKFFLGIYTVKIGNKVDSSSLVAVGNECKNDSFASSITILSSIIFLLFNISLDAYAGIIISVLILKTGYKTLKETVSDLIGRPGDHNLGIKLYGEIRGTEGIISAADMMLHNYGPDAWSGSVNVEIDHNKTVGEIYQILHSLQLKIMHEYKVTMVFGVYAVDYDHENMKILRKDIHTFMKAHSDIKSFHALYIDSTNKEIYCDYIVDYNLKDWDSLQKEFNDYMKILYPDYNTTLTIETEFV